MKKWFSCVFFVTGICILTAMLTGCGKPSSQKNESDNSAAFDSVRLPAYSGDTEVAITHSVKDFNEWLDSYNENSDPNARVSIYTSSDDPNLITIYELTRSHEDARNALNSEDNKNEMQEAGVNSTPVVVYYDIKYRAESQTEKLYRLSVSHEVENYERWRQGFNRDEPIREEAGLELRWIATEAEHPNFVHVIFATNDIQKAKDVITSVDLKKRMKEAGVVSGPDLVVLRIPNQ